MGWQVAVPSERLGYLVGRGGSNIQSLKAKTGVVSVDIDDNKSTVQLMGVASAVTNAKILIRAQVRG